MYYKHGKSKTRLYKIWQGIKTRCYNKSNRGYHDYGERGIKVCQEWLDDFGAFYNWAINNGYQDNLTIDHIDVNKGYEPDNCRWTTPKQQANNRRNNIMLTYANKTQNMKQWSETLKIPYAAVLSRHTRNGSVEYILFGSLKNYAYIKDCLSRKMTLHEVANKWGIALDNVMNKYHQVRVEFTDEQIETIMEEVYYLDKQV